MAITDLTSSIEVALKQATGFESFARGLLRVCLRWLIDRNAAGPSGRDLRFSSGFKVALCNLKAGPAS
jgi:hypothetical protein